MFRSEISKSLEKMRIAHIHLSAAIMFKQKLREDKTIE